MPRVPTIAIAAVVCALSLGCNKRQDKKPDEPSTPGPTNGPTAEPGEKPTGVAEHMKEHFARVKAVRDAVISGDFEATRAPSRWLAEHGAPKNIPDPWIPLVTDFRVMSGGLQDATGIEGVALALGPLARACGSCHLDLKANIKYSLPDSPTGDSFRDSMARHRWAANLLWDAVVIPSNEAWTRGAEHFATTKLAPEKAAGIDELVENALFLGKKAVKTTDPTARGNVYGELLATCSACHELTGVKPK